MSEPTYGFTQKDVTRIAKAVRGFEHAGSLGGADLINANQSYIAARVVTIDGTNTAKIGWQQLIIKADGTYIDGPLSGTTTLNPAYEINGHAPTIGDKVMMFRRAELQSDNSILMTWWFINYSLPCPQYDFMYLGSPTRNTVAWINIRAHP